MKSIPPVPGANVVKRQEAVDSRMTFAEFFYLDRKKREVALASPQSSW
jgi:hypothetical protein